MSDLRKAAEQALEALESGPDVDPIFAGETITALRAALAIPEQTRSQQMRDAGYTRRPRQLPKEDEQEPVAFLWQHGETGRTRVIEKDQVWTASNQWNRVGPLYLHPPQRKPLTEEEIEYIAPVSFTWRDMVTFARNVECEHGIV